MSNREADLGRTVSRIDALSYRMIKAAMLRTLLVSARHGGLDVDWRTNLLEFAAEHITDDSHLHHLRIRAAEEVANLPDADWEPDMKVGWRESLEAWYAATKECTDELEGTQRHIHREAGLPETSFSMDRDLDAASYRAGLTAAGLVSNWFEWLHDRVLTWPHGPRRESQLAAMDDPDYRRQLQQLPRYWA